MKILVSNDDGINAPGLKVIEKIAHELSDDVYVVAPEQDQSGVSHSLTLRNPLRIRQLSERRFAVNGTPTDCVLLGVHNVFNGEKPDLVLSGVNYGGNIAEDVTYSGTIAAAMEGAMLGIPSFALSLIIDPGHPAKWSTAENHAPQIIRSILEYGVPKGIVINLNFPNMISTSIKGITVTSQGQRGDEIGLYENKDPRGDKYYWVGPIDYTINGSRGTDLEAIASGKISVTPLSLQLTHRPTLRKLKEIFVD